VADLAILPEQVAPGGGVGRVRAERIVLLSRRGRHAMAQQPHGNCNFYPRRRLPGAGEAREREDVECHRAAEHNDDGNNGDPCEA
jgi:hypothetical protein